MTTLPLKSSRNEQRAVIRFFLWANGLNANEIHSEMRPVYGDKCFTRPAIHVWCTNFARGRESIVDKERPGRLGGMLRRPMPRLPQLMLRTVRWDKCLNKLRRYVENETLMFNI